MSRFLYQQEATVWYDDRDYEATVWYRYEPGEPAYIDPGPGRDLDHPGAPAEVEVVEIEVDDDEDGAFKLDPDDIENLEAVEERLLENHDDE